MRRELNFVILALACALALVLGVATVGYANPCNSYEECEEYGDDYCGDYHPSETHQGPGQHAGLEWTTWTSEPSCEITCFDGHGDTYSFCEI